MGSYAAHLIAKGKYGGMVAMVNGKITSIDLSLVADKIKYVEEDDRILKAGRSIGTCFGD